MSTFRRVALAAILLLIFLFTFLPFSSFSNNDDGTDTVAQADVSVEVSGIDGEKLFKTNCKRCHKPDKEFTGPALKGVRDRVPKPADEWIVNWVHNSQKVIQSGDVYAIERYEKYNRTEMDAFPNLSETEIFAILDYVDAWMPATGGGGADGEVVASDGILGKLFIGLAVILLIIMFTLMRIVLMVGNMVREKEGLPPREGISIKTVVLNPKVGIAAAIVFAIWLSIATFNGAASLGRSQGYAPIQPIAFSHKIHAGKNKIDCKYCHSGTEKSKTAGIPSMNVCMNCHKAIQEYPEIVFSGNTGTEEIAKLLDAVENEKPIEWIKVHNLPDHVFFSHKQHIAVGKLECEACHGDVKEMDVLEQHAKLSMGWCVNCHRDTEVQFADNSYYKMFEEIHEDLKNKKIETVTADMTGAVECQKCHY